MKIIFLILLTFLLIGCDDVTHTYEKHKCCVSLADPKDRDVNKNSYIDKAQYGLILNYRMKF